MDKATLVMNGFYQGRLLLDLLADRQFLVLGATWLKESDADRWYLHVVTPPVTTVDEYKAARVAVSRAVDDLPPAPLYPNGPDFGLDSGDVRGVTADDHLGKRILQLYDGRHLSTDGYVYGGRFDPYEYEPEVYLYRVPAPAVAG